MTRGDVANYFGITKRTLRQILEEGPVLLWQSRQYEIGHAESNWFSIMPAAAISGIMTFVLGEKLRVETGLASHESCGLSAEIAPETVTKRIVTGKCVHCVRPCRMKEGEYIFEDYEPILEYASEQGYASRGWLVTYGLAHIHANTDPTYYLDIWLPIQEKEKQ